jgi:hypothetical protein
LAYDSLSP